MFTYYFVLTKQSRPNWQGHGRLNVLGDSGSARLIGTLVCIRWYKVLWPPLHVGHTLRSQSGSDMMSNYDWRTGACLKCQNAWRLEGHVHCTKIIRLHSWAHSCRGWSSTPQSLPCPPSEFKQWNKRTLCTVLYFCIGLFQMQTAKVTVYGRGVYHPPQRPWCVPPQDGRMGPQFLIIMHLKCCADMTWPSCPLTIMLKPKSCFLCILEAK